MAGRSEAELVLSAEEQEQLHAWARRCKTVEVFVC